MIQEWLTTIVRASASLPFWVVALSCRMGVSPQKVSTLFCFGIVLFDMGIWLEKFFGFSLAVPVDCDRIWRRQFW